MVFAECFYRAHANTSVIIYFTVKLVCSAAGLVKENLNTVIDASHDKKVVMSIGKNFSTGMFGIFKHAIHKMG